jgi:2-keto-4-pentenoate hydratase
VTAFRNGSQAAVGSGKAVLGDPRTAMTWLANEVARHGGGLKAGQFVTTGTCVIPVKIESGDEISVDYGILGTIAVAIG